MNEVPLNHFKKLKEKVRLYADEHLHIHKALKDWSLNDIRNFQVDLEEKCKSTVSEKWFYTHLKNEGHKLPRIDVLNLLSAYCGYKNWDDFVFQQPAPSAEKPQKKNRIPRLIIISMALLLSAAFIFWPRTPVKVIHLSDAYTQEKVALNMVDFWFKPGQTLSSAQKERVRVVADTLHINGAYYKSQKVFLGLAADTLNVRLYPDDYALMLNYFSRSTTQNWQKRRQQLLEAIHPEAKIFQSHPQYEGIELLNRDEFIDRLILPVNSLKNLEIQDIVYQNEKIYRLRFVQKTTHNE
jgi:hypothetical protein